LQTFIIKGRLPGLNEIINSSKGHWSSYRKLKNEAMETVQWCILQHKIKPVGKARIIIKCYEPNAKRDVDNVLAGAWKIILDAMQKAGTIDGDGRKYIEILAAPVEIDRVNPRIEVSINEL